MLSTAISRAGFWQSPIFRHLHAKNVFRPPLYGITGGSHARIHKQRRVAHATHSFMTSATLWAQTMLTQRRCTTDMCENKDCSLANLKEARGERNFSTAVSTPPTLLHSSPHGPSLPPRTSSGLVLAVACQKVSIDAFCCAEAPAFNLSSFLVRTLLGTRVSFCSMMGYKYIVLPCWFIFKTSKRPSSFLQEIALSSILIQTCRDSDWQSGRIWSAASPVRIHMLTRHSFLLTLPSVQGVVSCCQ